MITSTTLEQAVPLSGVLEERTFGSGPNYQWVHFQSDTGGGWYGAFAEGDLGGRVALLMHTARHAFVLAKGVPYIVSVIDRAVVNLPTETWLRSAFAIPERELVLAADHEHLYLYAPSGLRWQSADHAVNGYRFDAITSETVHGSYESNNGTARFELIVEPPKFRHVPAHDRTS